jgi:hypothetical protein
MNRSQQQRGGNNKMSVWRPGDQVFFVLFFFFFFSFCFCSTNRSQQQPAAPVPRQEEEIGLDEEAFGIER